MKACRDSTQVGRAFITSLVTAKNPLRANRAAIIKAPSPTHRALTSSDVIITPYMNTTNAAMIPNIITYSIITSPQII